MKYRRRLAILFALFLFLPVFAAENMDDVSRLNSTSVTEILKLSEVKDLQAALVRAKKENLKVSIAGARHSQGGHIFSKDALVLDMKSFNQVLSLNTENKTITVQSGITWHEVQNAAAAKSLAVKVQQASNIFTVGGSLSVNAHGRDPRYASIVETVNRFHLMTADGKILNVSRQENPELFSAVIGGYGLFGIILDVELQLTDDKVLEKSTLRMNYKDYVSYFRKNIQNNPDVELHYARPSIARKGYLTDFTVSSYKALKYASKNKPPKNIFVLKEEGGIARNKAFFALSRKYGWGKDFRWFMQDIFADGSLATRLISRNSAMRPEVQFLEYKSEQDTDILQEYFVPPDRLPEFMEGMKKIFLEDKVNLLSITLRYVKPNQEIILSYDTSEMFAAVLYINQGLSLEGKAKPESWTRKMVDLAQGLGGNYYLPYQLYPTKAQLLKGYPRFPELLALKKKIDPDERFVNQFYLKYK